MINYTATRNDILTLIFAYHVGFDYNDELAKHGEIKSSPYRGEWWEWNRESFASMPDDQLVDFLNRLRNGEMVRPVSNSDAKEEFAPVSLPLYRRQFPELRLRRR